MYLNISKTADLMFYTKRHLRLTKSGLTKINCDLDSRLNLEWAPEVGPLMAHSPDCDIQRVSK